MAEDKERFEKKLNKERKKYWTSKAFGFVCVAYCHLSRIPKQ